jgi:F-type H+-transporting ATPase subunit a
MFCLHLISELIKPISLSLRLRSNVWGDDVLLAVLGGFGLKGFVLLFFNTLMAVLTAVVQAMVFCILTTIYFALVMPEQD